LDRGSKIVLSDIILLFMVYKEKTIKNDVAYQLDKQQVTVFVYSNSIKTGNLWFFNYQ